MSKSLGALSVWSDVVSNSGTQTATFRPRNVVGAEDRQALDGTDRATFSVVATDPARAQVQEGNVLRAEFRDGTWDEWRVVGVEESLDSGGAVLAKFECEGISLDIGRLTGLLELFDGDGKANLDWQLIGISPSEWIDVLVAAPDFPSYIAKGTVDPTDAITIPVQGDSPLAIIRQLEKLTGAEYVLRRNGTTDYKIDLLTERGSTAEVAVIAAGRQLTSVKRRSSILQRANRIYPMGSGPPGVRPTMGDHQWKVSATATSTVDLSDPFGSVSPIAFDDQLNGLYLEKPSGGLLLINDTIASTQRLDVGSGHGLNVNDIIAIRRNASGQWLSYLEKPTAKAANKLQSARLDRDDIAADNMVLNPFLSNWTGGNPDNWADVGTPTVTEETAREFVRHGSSSAKVVVTNGGDGIQSDAITIAPTQTAPFFCVQVDLKISALTAGAWVAVQIEDVTNSKLYPPTGIAAGVGETLDRWLRINVQPGINFHAVSSTSLRVKITTYNGVGTYYVDGVQLSQVSSPWPDIVEGRSANRLWAAANEKLSSDADPELSFDSLFIDLNRVDASTFPNDEVVVGGTVTLKADAISLDSDLRIQDRRRNLLVAGDTKIVLAKRRPDIARLLQQVPYRDPIDLAPPESGAKGVIETLDNISGTLDDIADGSTFLKIAGVNGSNLITSASILDGAVIAGKLTENAQSFNTALIFSATDYNTVSWGAAGVTLADGTNFSIAAGNTGNMAGPTWIYLDPVASTTVLQTTTTFGTAVGDRKVLLCYAVPSADTAQSAFYLPAVGTVGINSTNLSPVSVATAAIQDDAISAPKILANAVTAVKIDAGAVTTAKLDALAVTAEKIAASAVETDKLDALAVTAAKIAANAIYAAAIQTDAVTTDKIQANAVTAAKINVAQLSAIAADVGELTAGELHNVADTRGVLLSGTIPGTWTRYLNLIDDTKPFLKHEKMSLEQDGTGKFSGVLLNDDLNVEESINEFRTNLFALAMV